MQSDLIEIVSQAPPFAAAPYTLEPLSQGPCDGFGLGLASEFGECPSELIGLLVSNVQWHEIHHV